jgi:hypothetical protein
MLAHREALRPRTLSPDERSRLLALGTDLLQVWQAPTTLPRDKKELLRTVLEEVIITVDKERRRAHLTLRWRGGALSEIDTDLPPRRSAPIRTAEDTVALVRRLAAHYSDAVIAGILNRQERRTAYGHRFTAGHVGTLRRRYNIPIFERPSTKPDGELVNIRQATDALGVATSTIHRWLNEGIIAGEQLTRETSQDFALVVGVQVRRIGWKSHTGECVTVDLRLISISGSADVHLDELQ